MSLHDSLDPEKWNLASELRLLGFGRAPITRRDAIRLGLLGSAGVLVGGALAARARAAVNAAAATSSAALPLAPIAPAVAPKARSVIQIWLWGGPCHIDTFDPKPAAGYDYVGPLTT